MDMTTERRRYFRLDDAALLKYRVVAEEDLSAARAAVAAHAVHAANLVVALEPLEARLAELMPALRKESRPLAEAIDVLNRKLGLVASVMALEHGSVSGGPWREHEPTLVNLGGGGLALTAPLPLALNAWLAIDLVLLPTNHPLRAVGRVVDCRGDGEEFVVRVEFDTLREEDRDLIVSHLLRRQAEALKRERQARD